MYNTPYINSNRQKRAIQALLIGPIAVRALGPMIGALNPCQTISELRKQGFENIIMTRYNLVIDRDGAVCHPGEYYIADEHKIIAEEALISFTQRTPGTPPWVSDYDCSYKNQYNKKGDSDATPFLF